MKKKPIQGSSCLFDDLPKILRIMKLICVFMFVVLLQVSANSYSQTAKLSLTGKNLSLEKVFEMIEEQSEFSFLYNLKQVDLSKKVDVDFQNVQVEKILDQILKGTNITYTLNNRLVIIHSEGEKYSQIALLGNQQKLVAGKVTDTRNQPLPGVTVVVKGTTNGTVTNADGEYSLSNIPANATLQFSFVGMKTLEVVAGNQININVVMEEEAIGIEEVVAVGYGIQRKSNLSGAISSVKSNDITKLPTQRVDQALQGRAAGVTIMNTDGSPGGNTTIRIRGNNSITGSNSALVVVDGIQGVNINTLNPKDIESVEVLKDASATAIYGSRGANGVVLITTKRGLESKPTLAYSMSYGIQKLGKKLDLMNAVDYASTVNANLALANGAGEIPPTPAFTNQEIADFEKKGGTDWQDEIFRIAPIQNHYISVRGGSSSFKYFFSGAYLHHEGILLNSSYDRYNLRGNINTDINKWLSFGLNLSVIKEQGGSPGFGGSAPIDLRTSGSINGAARWAPTVPVYDEDGNYSKAPTQYGPSDTWNPVASALEVSPLSKKMNNSGEAYLDFKLLDGLTLRVSGMTNILNNMDSWYFNQYTFEGKPKDGGKIGQASVSNSILEEYQNTNMLTYDKSLGIHHITFTAVAEQSVSKYYVSSISASQFAVDQTEINNLGGASLRTVSSNAYKRALDSYLARVNYSYNDKYLMSASYRADGSSVFGKNNKWGYFPAISVAWRVSEEKFIKSIDFISNLKLRGSIGATGNQAISPYSSLAKISAGDGYPWDGGIVTNTGYLIMSLSNQNLRWETTVQSDLGLDFALFDGRLTSTIDVYKKKTKDLLLYRQLPGSSGITSIIDNIGSVENKGMEITLGGDILTGDLKWNSGFNISFNRSKVIDMGDDLKMPFTTYHMDDRLMYLVVGKPFGQMYGWKYLGTWKESERADAAVFGQLPGDSRYADTNNDKTIDINDLTEIGNSSPKSVFGWSNQFTYKNIELSILFQGTYGNDIFNQLRVSVDGGGWQDGTGTALLDRWTIDNQDTDVPAFIDNATRESYNYPDKVNDVDSRTSRWVEDGSYLRLKNLTLAYNIPKLLLSAINISNLRVYASGTNLLTFTKYKGYDPEVSSFTSNDALTGVDLGNYPSSKVFTFGIEVLF